MKLTCDLCGSALQINLGGQGATCTHCGLGYTMDRLREKLSGQKVQQDPPKHSFDYVPQQFRMENTDSGNGDICGRVQQGGIGLGDMVYIDGNYDRPYKVYLLNDDPYMFSAKAGMPTDLYLLNCPRKVWKNARVVTGDPHPVANAYNYPGTVEAYFSHLLLSTFNEYEIRENVTKNNLDIPVDYLLYKDGRPVLAVFLIGSNNNMQRRLVKRAARTLALEGVACTHFYENYRNDAPYVIERVRSALG